jgi:hypothetical protein
MIDGKRREQWSHTSHLIAALVNSNPFRKGEPVSPDTFNPYAQEKEQPAGKEEAIKMPLKMLRYIMFPGTK